MYEDDTPAAERRVQALTLDRDLLRELLGADELRDLLDPEALETVERDLARGARTRGRRPARPAAALGRPDATRRSSSAGDLAAAADAAGAASAARCGCASPARSG